MPARPKKATLPPKDDVIRIRTTAELKAKLIVIAERSGQDLSNYGRAALLEKARREGNEI